MRPYSLLIAFDVFDFVAQQGRPDQLALRKRMLQIRDYPHNYSDYSEPDTVGRPYHINLLGGYAIKYWIDDADQQIKIMEIRPSDREL